MPFDFISAKKPSASSTWSELEKQKAPIKVLYTMALDEIPFFALEHPKLLLIPFVACSACVAI